MLIHTFETMGTVASIRMHADTVAEQALAQLELVFCRYAHRFSLYRSDSELSRIASRQTAMPDASEQLRSVYAQAMQWRNATGGDFTPHRPDGPVDLAGIVKALAMNEAASHLDRLSVEGWLLDVGGDVLTSGRRTGHASDRWRVGIVDPANRSALLCALDLRSAWRAVATSGTAERGEHVWRSDAICEFTQVTVLAADIVTADVLATAILSGGRNRLDAATRTYPIDVITVSASGEILATPRVRREMTAQAPNVCRPFTSDS